MRKSLFTRRASAAEATLQEVRNIIANVNVPNGTTRKIDRVVNG